MYTHSRSQHRHTQTQNTQIFKKWKIIKKSKKKKIIII